MGKSEAWAAFEAQLRTTADVLAAALRQQEEVDGQVDRRIVAYDVQFTRHVDGRLEKVRETVWPAPSSPRRWWLPFDMGDRPCSLPVFHMPEPHEWAFYWQTVVPVVEASAYDAVVRERDLWQETAAQESRNTAFYCDIVRQIGAQFGVAARTSDDGSVQDSVLALKVPELVAELAAERDAARAELANARRLTPEVVETVCVLLFGSTKFASDVHKVRHALLAAGFQEVAP